MNPSDAFGTAFKVSGRILQSDIKNGKVGDSYNCPLALAIKRELAKMFPDRLGRNLFVSVGISSIVLTDVDTVSGFNYEDGYRPHDLARASLTHKLYCFVRDFDLDSAVKPQRFTLEFQPNPLYANATI